MRPPFALPKTTRSLALRRSGAAAAHGDRGGPYEVVRRLGLGARTEVLLAVGRGPFGLARPVTLKRPRPDLADAALADATAALVREAHAYARLAHPSVVRLYDFVVDGGRPTLVMESIDGTSLGNLLGALASRGEKLDDASALFIGYRLFSALTAAHHAHHPITAERAPVVHGDVCLDTILVPWDGNVKLVDFGNAAATSTETDDVRAACEVLRDLVLRSLHRTSPPGLAAALERGLSPDPRRRLLSAPEMASILQRLVDVEGARLLLVEHLARLRRELPHPAPPPRPAEERHDEGDDSEPTHLHKVAHPTSAVVPKGRADSGSMPASTRPSQRPTPTAPATPPPPPPPLPPLPRPPTPPASTPVRAAIPPPPLPLALPRPATPQPMTPAHAPTSRTAVTGRPRALALVGRPRAPMESRSASEVAILVVRVGVIGVTLAAAIVAAYLYFRA